MFCLFDTFNSRIISRHRSVDATIHADLRHKIIVTRVHGRDSYIPTDIRKLEDGEPVKIDQLSDEYAQWLYSPARAPK